VLIVGLGCEANQIGGIVQTQKLTPGPKLQTFTIQETGGTARSVALGIERVKELLPDANRAVREPVPASHLTVGMQCGGSDGYSGISANPVLGAAVTFWFGMAVRPFFRRRRRSTAPSTC
jgi:altronate hydrolase